MVRQLVFLASLKVGTVTETTTVAITVTKSLQAVATASVLLTILNAKVLTRLVVVFVADICVMVTTIAGITGTKTLKIAAVFFV